LFPLFACLYLLIRIAWALTDFIKPLVSFLPENRYIGVAVADVASVLILLLLCFVAGLIVKTSAGSSLGQQLTRFFNKIPGYRMFGRIARIMFDVEDARGSPVVVHHGDTKQIGFLMEENSAHEMTIFFPGAPNPFSGSIVIVRADAVERLEVPRSEVTQVIASFGAGTSALLDDREPKKKEVVVQLDNMNYSK
jgi:uncharacterized membrane protein